jgi:hypothetical protein
MGDDVSDQTSPPLHARGSGPSAAAVALVDGLVQDATRALFANYGVELELDDKPVASTLGSVQLVSVIGFSSPAFSGSLLLASPNSVVEHTVPTPDANLADWSGELSNQLLGRLKNLLLDYHVQIDISLPVVIAGGRFALPARTRALTRYSCFASEWGRVLVRLEAELSPGFELVRQGETKQGMGEGEHLLF